MERQPVEEEAAEEEGVRVDGGVDGGVDGVARCYLSPTRKMARPLLEMK